MKNNSSVYFFESCSRRNRISLTSLAALILLNLNSCRKEEVFDQEIFTGEYKGNSTSGIYNFEMQIAPGQDQNELLIDDLRNYGDISPLTTYAVITSETEFAIPDHVYVHHANSPGGGCTTCVSYPYLVKYNGGAQLDQAELSVNVNTFHKFPDDADFVLFKKETITLSRQ